MYEERAEQVYRDTKPYKGKALDNHCIRLAEFSLALARQHGVDLEEDLVRAVSWLHDIGLMIKQEGEPDYLHRGLSLVLPILDDWDLSWDQRRLVREMMLFNHALRPVPGLSPQAELFRQSVQVEHSYGLIRHGLEATTIREVFACWPRSGLSWILADFTRITLFEDGPRQLLGIFFPSKYQS